MEIFVDESGTFTTRPDGAAIGVVGALVVTESQLPLLQRLYTQLRPMLPKEKGEVKGRLLGEADVARVVRVARRSGLIYEAVVVSLAPGDEPLVDVHRRGQCEGLTKHLTEEHHPNIVAFVHALRDRLQQMPLQLYVQFVATSDVVWKTLCHATAYYSQREPETLARFRWVIDAKAPEAVTSWEDWWTKVVKPFAQAQSLQEPFPQLEAGDYSHFLARDVPVPAYFRRAFPHLKESTVMVQTAILEEIEFSPNALPGLELVDVLTNALRRALTGRLGQGGWGGLSGLMIHRRGQTYVQPVGFGSARQVVPPATAMVLRRLGKGGRSMLTDKLLRE